MRPIRYIGDNDIALSHLPKVKEICPSITEDMNTQSSHWSNGKMKITCNSACVQTETLNVTFAWYCVFIYLFQLQMY